MDFIFIKVADLLGQKSTVTTAHMPPLILMLLAIRSAVFRSISIVSMLIFAINPFDNKNEVQEVANI
jgi:hypothetical protein